MKFITARLNKRYFSLAAFLVLFIHLLPASAAFENYSVLSVKFNTDSGDSIGNAKIAYDNSTTDFIKESTFSGSSEGFYTNALIEYFSGNINGYTLNQVGPALNWFVDSNGPPGSRSEAYGDYYFHDYWVFGDYTLAYSLIMNLSNNHWWIDIYPTETQQIPYEQSGTFDYTLGSYQPVPIPAAIPLFATGLAGIF